jgi:fimbrial chaperone protein
MRKLMILWAAGVAAMPALSHAASLQVSPVNIEVKAPGAATTLKLRNEGQAPLNAQIRVFRWSQSNGEEKLEPTDDIVASPPMATLAPKADYTVRLVRVTKRPIAAEESYRLIIDELPDPKAKQNKTVALVLRYSIPVFFYRADATQPNLTWSIDQRGGRASVTVTNAGTRHARISALQLRSSNGTTVSFGNGLTGYALGGSVMRWIAPPNSPRIDGGTPIVITGQADTGPINVTAPARPAR